MRQWLVDAGSDRETNRTRPRHATTAESGQRPGTLGRGPIEPSRTRLRPWTSVECVRPGRWVSCRWESRPPRAPSSPRSNGHRESKGWMRGRQAAYIACWRLVNQQYCRARRRCRGSPATDRKRTVACVQWSHALLGGSASASAPWMTGPSCGRIPPRYRRGAGRRCGPRTSGLGVRATFAREATTILLLAPALLGKRGTPRLRRKTGPHDRTTVGYRGLWSCGNPRAVPSRSNQSWNNPWTVQL